MRRDGLHKVAACFMIGIVVSFSASCGQKGSTRELRVEIAPTMRGDVDPQLTDQFKASTADFSIRLFKECATKEENMMISPTSMLLAMSMPAQGANGNTLLAMQKAMYGGVGEEDSRMGLLALQNQLFRGKNDCIREANSIWFKNKVGEFRPNDEFIQRNMLYLGAEMYAAKFDQSTVKEINSWVSDKTDGHIKEIVKEISNHDIMHLINTVSFDGEWETPYEKEDLQQAGFTTIKGERQEVSYMNSTEDGYIKDEKSQGVIKPYKDGYSFVAILPNEGVSLSDYIKGMNGASFTKMIAEAENDCVETKIPKFKSEYSILAKEALCKMGMSDAFDSAADFSGICGKKGEICISSVLQKTFIEVDEKGTKASAATDVTMKETSVSISKRMRTVQLTRPFIYAIINDKTSLPVFMGMVTTI